MAISVAPLSQRIETIREAFTIRRVVALSTLGAAASLANQIPTILAQHGDAAMTFGAPGWALAAIAVLLLTIFYLWEYAHRQRMALLPKFEVSFQQNGLGLVQGVVEHYDPFGQVVKAYEALYVRIQVDAATERALRCTAFIIDLEKSIDGGATFRKIRLPQPVPLYSGTIDVIPHVPSMVDFIQANDGLSGQHKIYPTGRWPFRFRDSLMRKDTTA